MIIFLFIWQSISDQFEIILEFLNLNFQPFPLEQNKQNKFLQRFKCLSFLKLNFSYIQKSLKRLTLQLLNFFLDYFILSILLTIKFFFKKALKKTLALALFYCCSRQIKTYLHRPIEIMYFLTTGYFKNVSHNFKIFLHFQQYTICKLSRAHNQGFFNLMFLFVLQFHMLTNYI